MVENLVHVVLLKYVIAEGEPAAVACAEDDLQEEDLPPGWTIENIDAIYSCDPYADVESAHQFSMLRKRTMFSGHDIAGAEVPIV